MSPLQTLWSLIFNDYADGSVYNLYNNATSYIPGDRVIYPGRQVFQCATASTGNLPTNPAFWNPPINDNYIGARERFKYNARKITYEFALNRWFICTGIYITNMPIQQSGFILGQTGPYSSPLTNSSLSTSSNSPSYLLNVYTVPSIIDYIIWVPILVFNTLGATVPERVQTVRAFADTVNLAGM